MKTYFKHTIILIIAILLTVFITSCGTSKEQLSVLQGNYDKINSENEKLKKEVESLKTENASLNTQLEPYKELEAAEAERKAEEDRNAAEVARQEREAQAKAEEEARLAQEEKARQEKEAEEKRGYDTGITYQQLARTPDEYKYKKVKFRGKAVQVIEGEKENNIRLAVNSNYEQMILVVYDKNIVKERVLEDDIITVYGTSGGLHTYTSTMGGPITIPYIEADKFDQ